MTDARRRRIQRARPVAAMALVAFVIGAIVGAHSGASAVGSLAGRFVKEWTRGEYASMYQDVDDATKRSLSVDRFARVYREALTMATATGAHVAGHVHGRGEGVYDVPVRVSTRLFGPLALPFELHIVEAGGQGARVAWSHSEAF